MEIFFIFFGLLLIAKHQVMILKYRYKCAEICPERLFGNAHQLYLLTRLSEKQPRRRTVFIPLLGRRVKRLLYSEIAGICIIFGSIYWAWNYSTDFPLILSIVLGGASWIFITKYALTIMLKLCDYPSVKHIAIAVITFPALLFVSYALLYLLVFFNIYNLPYFNI